MCLFGFVFNTIRKKTKGKKREIWGERHVRERDLARANGPRDSHVGSSGSYVMYVAVMVMVVVDWWYSTEKK